MKFFFYLLAIIFTSESYLIPKLPFYIKPKTKTKTFLHLEKFNEKYNLLHIGVSFISANKCARFDFRQSEEQMSFMTYTNYPFNYIYFYLLNKQFTIRQNPDIYPLFLLDYEKSSNKFQTIDIYWGSTNKSIEEIIEFEKTLNKKYILGINDCRHYSRKLTKWALDKPTPIWKLSKLFNKYKKK